MNREITLEQLKHMSYGNFDKIVDLYSQGYKLSNAIGIRSLAASGEIVSAIASKDAAETYITVAFYHTEPNGYVHINATGAGITALNDYTACRGGFSELLRIAKLSTIGAAVGDVTITSKLCATNDGCPADAICGAESAIITTKVVTPITHVPSAPGNVVGLTATPGDGTINISWSAPTSGVIYGYTIEIISSGISVMNGFQTGTTFNATGLTNGTSYTIEVRSLSTSSISGGASTISATPTATTSAKWKCTNPNGISGSKCTSGIDSTYTYNDQATCEAASDCQPTVSKKTNYTPYILVGAALAAAYIIFTPTEKKTTSALPTSAPMGTKPLPTIRKEEAKPETPKLSSEERFSLTKQKEEDSLKELEALSKQKEETKRLREIEDKKDKVKKEIAEMYVK